MAIGPAGATGTAPNGAHNATLQPGIWLWRDPTSLPPRQWLLGSALLRGQATLLGSPGGTGKTALAVAMALAVITGRRDICGLHSFLRGRVWFITLEDDLDELARRIAAAMLEHKIAPADVGRDLWVNHPDLTLLTQSRDHVARLTDDVDLLIDYIRQSDFLLVVIDPLVKAHKLEENSNDHMDALITAANQIARETRAAVLLPHHFRKDSALGGRDAIRGGGALVDGARIALTMLGMSAAEAEGFGVPEDDAGRYVRLANAKANMTPKARAEDWYELVSVPLGNTAVDPLYPSGDEVQAIVPWQQPKLMDGMDYTVMSAIFGRLRDATQIFHETAGNQRNPAFTVVMALANKTKEQAKRIIQLWLDSGTLERTTYQNDQRNDRIKLTLNASKAAAILAGLSAAHSPP